MLGFYLLFFFDDAFKNSKGNKNVEIIENPIILTSFLFGKYIKIINYIIFMKTIFLFFLMIYIFYYLFRPVTKKEIEKFENPDNWSNMGF